MTDQEKQEYLTTHIPHRIKSISFSRCICEFLIKHDSNHDLLVRFGNVVELKAPSMRFFSNPVIESGIMNCRVMLEFLGIKVQSPSEQRPFLVERNRKYSTDVSCEDFGVEPIKLPEMRASFSSNSPIIEEAVSSTLHIANKELAHMTETAFTQLLVGNIALTCKLTTELANNHFYRSLGLPPVEEYSYMK